VSPSSGTVCRRYLYEFVKTIPLPAVELCSRRTERNCVFTHPTLTLTVLLNFVSLLSDYFFSFFACSSLCLIEIFVMYVCWSALGLDPLYVASGRIHRKNGFHCYPKNTSIVACLFVASETYLPRRCLAINVYSDSTITAFRC
jgi:hypothetical protein